MPSLTLTPFCLVLHKGCHYEGGVLMSFFFFLGRERYSLHKCNDNNIAFFAFALFRITLASAARFR